MTEPAACVATERSVRNTPARVARRAAERAVRLALAAGGLALGACHSATVQAEQAAWISTPSSESRAELLGAVRTLVGEREIRLAENALTATHVLFLEPAVGNRIDGRVLGRNVEMPVRLELVLSDGRCYLVHTGSGERVRLRQTPCMPAPASAPVVQIAR